MQATKAKGRPRQFDIDEALERASQVFWRQGFQGASLSELTEATGLSKPSLYAAFGDKEALYLRCMEMYEARLAAIELQQLEGPKDVRGAIEGLLRKIVSLQCAPELPGGCLLVTGAADCGNPGTPTAIEEALRRASNGTTQRILKRLRRAEREGDLPAGTDAKKLASVFGAVLVATGLMAKAGRPRREIDDVVDGAMMLWPKAGEQRA